MCTKLKGLYRFSVAFMLVTILRILAKLYYLIM